MDRIAKCMNTLILNALVMQYYHRLCCFMTLWLGTQEFRVVFPSEFVTKHWHSFISQSAINFTALWRFVSTGISAVV